MPESETDDFAPQGSYMPPEEMMPDDVPPPDEYGYEERARLLFRLSLRQRK